MLLCPHESEQWLYNKDVYGLMTVDDAMIGSNTLKHFIKMEKGMKKNYNKAQLQHFLINFYNESIFHLGFCEKR